MQLENQLSCPLMFLTFCIELMCLLKKQTLKIQCKGSLSHHQTYTYNNFWRKDFSWSATCSYGIFSHSSIIVNAIGLYFILDMIGGYKTVFVLVGVKRATLTCLNFVIVTFIAFLWLMIRNIHLLSINSSIKALKKVY